MLFTEVFEDFKNGSFIKRKWWNQCWKFEGEKTNRNNNQKFFSGSVVDLDGNFKAYIKVNFNDLFCDDWVIVPNESERSIVVSQIYDEKIGAFEEKKQREMAAKKKQEEMIKEKQYQEEKKQRELREQIENGDFIITDQFEEIDKLFEDFE